MRVSVRKTNTADPVLNRIQDAVSEAVDDLDLYKSDALQFRYDREPIVQVGLSEAVVLMSTESTVRANLPAPSPANANRRCALARRDFGRTIIVTASGGNVQAIDADTLPSAAGLYIYYSTGSEWFRC